MITLEYTITRVNKNIHSLRNNFQSVAIRLKSKELLLREDIEKYLYIITIQTLITSLPYHQDDNTVITYV